jgi:hypothetical protein
MSPTKVSDSNNLPFSSTIASAVRLYFEPLQWLGRLLSLGLDEVIDGVLPGLRHATTKRNENPVSSKPDFVASEQKPETAVHAEAQKGFEELLLRHGRATQDAMEKIASSASLLERLREEIRIESQSLSHSAEILLAEAGSRPKISHATPLSALENLPLSGPMTLGGDILSEPMLDLVQLAPPGSTVYLGNTAAKRAELKRHVYDFVRFIYNNLGSGLFDDHQGAKLNQAIQILTEVTSSSPREHSRSMIRHIYRPTGEAGEGYSAWPETFLVSIESDPKAATVEGTVLSALEGIRSRRRRKPVEKPVASEPETSSSKPKETSK